MNKKTNTKQSGARPCKPCGGLSDTTVQSAKDMKIHTKLVAFEKAYHELRKEVLDMVGHTETPMPTKAPTRPKKFEFRDSTFWYECMDETRNQRLTAFFNGLKQLKLIDDRTDLQQFVDLFSGEPLFHRIKWTGGKAQLKYLFIQLIKQKKYVTTPGSRIWITVRSHFVQPNGKPFDENIKAQQMPGKRHAAELDALVEFLNPGKTLPSVLHSTKY